MVNWDILSVLHFSTETSALPACLASLQTMSRSSIRAVIFRFWCVLIKDVKLTYLKSRC